MERALKQRRTGMAAQTRVLGEGPGVSSTFVSGCSKRNATLAQLVERLIRNQQVAGSIPAGGSMF